MSDITTLDTLCLADDSFQNSFSNYDKIIEKVIDFSNKDLIRANVILKPTIKTWDTPKIKPSFSDYLAHLYARSYAHDRIIAFTDRHLAYPRRISKPSMPSIVRKMLTGEDGPIGIASGNIAIIANVIPVKIPCIYDKLLSCLTKHELGHTFGLPDTVGKELSIMDYVFGVFSHNFTKDQIEAIQRTR